MGVFEVREDNMPEPGGKDDLKTGHKIVEEIARTGRLYSTDTFDYEKKVEI